MNDLPLDGVFAAFERFVWLRVAGVLALTFTSAYLLEWIYRSVFRRIAEKTSTQLDDRFYDALHPAIRNSVILLGLGACVVILDPAELVTRITLSVLKSLAIFIWMVALIRTLSTMIRHLGRSRRPRAIQPSTVPLFDTLQKVAIAGAAAYFILLAWNINVTAWVASAGIVGLAVGLAAQDSLSNLFAGVFIHVDAPYRIGDMITFDTGERGQVTDVGIRSTRILTRDDVEIIIPNAAIGSAKITNESGGHHRKRRVDVRVGVSYASDIDAVRRVLLEVAEELEVVCASPEPRVRFRAMADSALTFSLLFWIGNPEEQGRAVDQANTRIFHRFREEGIEIPFPQRVIHYADPPRAR